MNISIEKLTTGHSQSFHVKCVSSPPPEAKAAAAKNRLKPATVNII
jgi:hypothetical protein